MRQLKRHRGTSMVEFLVAAFVIMIALAGVAGIYHVYSRSSTINQTKDLTLINAQNALVDARAASLYDKTAATDLSAASGTWSASYTKPDGSTGTMTLKAQGASGDLTVTASANNETSSSQIPLSQQQCAPGSVEGAATGYGLTAC